MLTRRAIEILWNYLFESYLYLSTSEIPGFIEAYAKGSFGNTEDMYFGKYRRYFGNTEDMI